MNKDAVVFAYARMNPPTRGHTRLVNLVRQIAKDLGCDHQVSISRTENSKTDPLKFSDKIVYLEMAFPKANLVSVSDHAPSMMDQLLELSGSYRDITVVCGSDRVNDYERMLIDYNDGHFGFKSFRVVSAGDRDESRYSSTAARELAARGDLRGFFEIVAWFDNGHDVVNLYDDVREGLGINTSDEEGKNAQKEDISKA